MKVLMQLLFKLTYIIINSYMVIIMKLCSLRTIYGEYVFIEDILLNKYILANKY